MKALQPDLITYPVFKTLGLFDPNIAISASGIVHTARVHCPGCGALCLYNGSSNKGRHILSRTSDSYLRKGQQYCPICEQTIQVDNPWIDTMIDSFNGYIESQVLSLSGRLSEDEIVTHLQNTTSIQISKSTVHNIISKSNDDLDNVEFEYVIKDHYYGYDEQYLKIDGKRAYRIVFFDFKENKLVYEKIHYRFSKKILKEILEEVFGEKAPKGFVVDMRVEYPKAFREVFGKHIKVQFCVFHLNKLILKEYADCLKIGNNVYWNLMHYHNLYSLFNIYYDRTFELGLLTGYMKDFENFKKRLTIEKIKYYVGKYDIKTKCPDKQRAKVLEIIEKKLMKAFRKILHDKKNMRRRQGKTLRVRSIESARKVFARLLTEKSLYPPKIQERIDKIDKNFDYFTGSDTEVLTNNKLEGFFGATLKKFRKKIGKSLVSFSGLLKRKRLEQSGKAYFRKFTIADLTQIFTALSFF